MNLSITQKLELFCIATLLHVVPAAANNDTYVLSSGAQIVLAVNAHGTTVHYRSPTCVSGIHTSQEIFSVSSSSLRTHEIVLDYFYQGGDVEAAVFMLFDPDAAGNARMYAVGFHSRSSVKLWESNSEISTVASQISARSGAIHFLVDEGTSLGTQMKIITYEGASQTLPTTQLCTSTQSPFTDTVIIHGDTTKPTNASTSHSQTPLSRLPCSAIQGATFSSHYSGSRPVCAVSHGANNECSGSVTHAQAELFCEEIGARLCSAKELLDDAAYVSGCRLHKQIIWSSDPCGVPSAYLALPATSKLQAPAICTDQETAKHPVRCCADSYSQTLDGSTVAFDTSTTISDKTSKVPLSTQQTTKDSEREESTIRNQDSNKGFDFAGQDVTASWSKPYPPLPVAMSEVGAVLVHRTLYILGNTDGPAAFMSLDLENADEWKEEPLPQHVSDHHALVTVNGLIYNVGGMFWKCPRDDCLGMLQIFNPERREWNIGAPLPYAVQGSISSVAIGNHIYACGGLIPFHDKTNPTNCAKYDPVTNTWSKFRRLLQKGDHAAAGTDGSNMYVFGGRVGPTNVPRVGLDVAQVYDPDENQWTYLPNMVVARAGMGTAPFAAGRLFVIGGETPVGAQAEATANGVFTQVHAFNVNTGGWEVDYPALTRGRHGIYPVTISDSDNGAEIIVVGGGDSVGNSRVTDVDVLQISILDSSGFDVSDLTLNPTASPSSTSTTNRITVAVTKSPQSDWTSDESRPTLNVVSWKKATDLPEEKREAEGLAFDGNFYVFGGFVYPFWSVMKRSVAMYNPVTNTWRKRKSVPIAGRGVSHAATATDGKLIYFAGGMVQLDGEIWPQAHSTTDVHSYNPADNSWNILPSLPGDRAAAAAACLDGVMHVLGGGRLIPTTLFVEDYDDHFVLDLSNVDAGWKSLAPITTPRNHLGAVAHRGRLYNFGGQFLELEHTTNQQIAEVYDAENDVWEPLPPLPVGIGHIQPSLVSYQDFIIIAGGRVNDHSDQDAGLWILDTARKKLKWVTEPAPIGGSSQIADMIDDNLLVQNGKYLFVAKVSVGEADFNTREGAEPPENSNGGSSMVPALVAGLIGLVCGVIATALVGYMRKQWAVHEPEDMSSVDSSSAAHSWTSSIKSAYPEAARESSGPGNVAKLVSQPSWEASTVSSDRKSIQGTSYIEA